MRAARAVRTICPLDITSEIGKRAFKISGIQTSSRGVPLGYKSHITWPICIVPVRGDEACVGIVTSLRMQDDGIVV